MSSGRGTHIEASSRAGDAAAHACVSSPFRCEFADKQEALTTGRPKGGHTVGGVALPGADIEAASAFAPRQDVFGAIRRKEMTAGPMAHDSSPCSHRPFAENPAVLTTLPRYTEGL